VSQDPGKSDWPVAIFLIVATVSLAAVAIVALIYYS
jgi:hypothetical protein